MPRHNATFTPKEAAFVTEYLCDKNGAAAAVRAGYSERSAKEAAYKLLQKPHIKAAIDKALKEQQKRTLISADANLKRIDRIAERAEREGDLAAALRASELIGKHHRSFSDKVELTGKNDGPVEFTEIRRTIVRPGTPKP
jgi:phage terminase small subunit